MEITYQSNPIKGIILLSVPWYVSGTHNYLDKEGKLKSMGFTLEQASNCLSSMVNSLLSDLKEFKKDDLHLLIVDDNSPFPPSIDWIKTLPLPTTVLKLDKNVGFGYVVNIIQSIAIAGRFDYLIRWDTDVWPENSNPFTDILNIFDNPNTFLVTFKNQATWYLFCLGDEEIRKGNHPRYIATRSMIGNILIYSVSKFKFVGLDEPLLRGYSDVELQYRSDWAGYNTWMDTKNVVKSIKSGANAIGDLTAQESQLKYLVGINPQMSYFRAKNRLVLRGNRKLGASHRFVPPAPLSIQACMKLGLVIDLLPFWADRGLDL